MNLKRVAGEELTHDSKRRKAESFPTDSTAIFRDPTQEKTPTDLLDWATGESGYISGKVLMKWPPIGQKYRIKMETFSIAHGKKQFEVQFSGTCGEEFQRKGFQFKLEQELHLSLRGVKYVSKKQGNLTANTIPVTLHYADEVALEILPKGQDPGCKIDTWLKPPAEPVSAQDDWFLTPKEIIAPVLAMTKGDLMDIDEESVPEKPTSRASASSVKRSEHPPPSPSPLNNIGNSLPSIAPPRQPASQAPTSYSSSSRPIRTMGPPLANIVPADSSVPKENPPDRRHPSIPPPRIVPPSHATSNHASTSKLVDRKPVGPVVEDLQPPHRARPMESEPPKQEPSPHNYPIPTTEPEAIEVLNKKQRKNKTRREKKKLQAGLLVHGAEPSLLASTTTIPRPSSVPPARITPVVSAPSPALPVTAPIPRSHPPQQSSSSRLEPTKATTETVSAAPEQRLRLQVPPGFTLISEINKIRHPGCVFSVIGVVTSSKPVEKTPRGEWICRLRLVDPSYYEPFMDENQGFAVNCFKKQKELLPNAKRGDVMILHGIKTPNSLGAGSAAVGYYDKLKWALYSEKKIGHGDLARVPESEGFGVQFCSFHQATPDDLACCRELEDWWRGENEKRQAMMGNVHQIGAASSISASTRSYRKHELISEISSRDAIGQYFDCTVEVLHGYQSERFYILYVTDYTIVTGGRPCQWDWCPSSLADSMLPIVMWDEAGKVGPTMMAGEFYSLKNARAMTDREEGYFQAKLVEPKIRKLELSDAESDPYLKALLERKATHGPIDDIRESDLKLIAQAGDKEYFSCVGELLHVDESQEAIFISDYTPHPKILAINESWAHGLGQYVLKVWLGKDQRTIVPSLKVGLYYRIDCLRFESTVTGKAFRGRLDGSSRLIRLVNPTSSVLAEWKGGLIERKTNLKRRIELQTKPHPTNAAEVVADSVAPSGISEKFSSIKQVLAATECPATFFVRARVVDFYPFQLDDSFTRVCNKCDQLIGDKRISCVACDDIERKHTKIVCQARVLIDDGSDGLKLSISGDIPLLKGLEHAILRDNPEAARQFSERLSPLLNNLVDAHAGILENRFIDPLGRFMTLVVDSWKRKNGTMVYGLREYKQ